MKTNSIKRVMMMAAAFMLLNVMPAMAQASDKDIIGVWYLESFHFEGEKEHYSKDTNYTNVKVFRANGEYACAQVWKVKDGKITLQAHEYGKYTLKNGIYSEMGRKETPHNWVDKTTFKGQWKNRHDIWKKIPNAPKQMEQYIVDICRSQKPTAEVQKMLQNNLFK